MGCIALPVLIRELRAHLRDTEHVAARRPDLDLVFSNGNGRPYDKLFEPKKRKRVRATNRSKRPTPLLLLIR